MGDGGGREPQLGDGTFFAHGLGNAELGKDAARVFLLFEGGVPLCCKACVFFFLVFAYHLGEQVLGGNETEHAQEVCLSEGGG